jgi:hypothetical protein
MCGEERAIKRSGSIKYIIELRWLQKGRKVTVSEADEENHKKRRLPVK